MWALGVRGNEVARSASPYVLPYPVWVKHNIRQGNCNDSNSHNFKTGETFAYDFEMPIGSTIVAAREGKVLHVIDKYTDDQHALSEPNGLYFDHGDGTCARYGHLTKNGILVRPGETVTQGQMIGRSGNSGLSKGPICTFRLQSVLTPKIHIRPIVIQNL